MVLLFDDNNKNNVLRCLTSPSAGMYHRLLCWVTQLTVCLQAHDGPAIDDDVTISKLTVFLGIFLVYNLVSNK